MFKPLALAAVIAAAPLVASADEVILASADAAVTFLPAGSSPWCEANDNEGCYKTMFVAAEPVLESSSARSSPNFAAINGYEDLDENVHTVAMVVYFFKDDG